uniref:Upstream transcription factor family member 3 n=1 Tax=Lepisosteus oculatus TaxID=7918 RepID=W5M5D4_LEPOC
MPEMTENQTPASKPHRKKNKETHNAVERHRKKKINAGINRIGELLPCSQALKQSKNMILDQAFKYITQLKQQNDELLLNGGNREQAEEIKRLRRQQEELRRENSHYIELLKANGISFMDDPTIHWKGKLKCTKVAKIPTHQVQEGIIVYSNGNIICPGRQDSPAQNVVFNVGQDLRKPAADAVIVQHSCDLTAAPVPRKCSNRTDLQKKAPAKSAKPTLPQASAAPVVAVAAHKVAGKSTLETRKQLPPSVSYITLQRSTAPTSEQSQPVVSGSCSKLLSANPTQVTVASVSPVKVLPLKLQQVKHSNLQHCPSVPQELAPQPVVQAPPVKALLTEKRAAVTLESSSSGLCHTVMHTAACLPSLASPANGNDSNGVSTLTRMTSSGNTQTTWTTLHLAGNTVQPLNQMASSVLPPSVNDNSSSSTDSSRQVLNTGSVAATPGLKGVSLCSVRTVTLPSIQPVPVQPLLTQPHIPVQTQPNVLPLLQAMQVIQMTNNASSAVPQAAHNPNVVILQPANPCPAPTVVREGLPSQTPCQQIVIIQAANQSSVLQNPQATVVPAAAPAVAPAANQIAASSCSAPMTSVQTVGGKHLVHILPRPLVSTACKTTGSAQTPQQHQPHTISVNGQIFALQPMKPSTGVSSQSPMQIIQPTTSEDPNTNVALNTFGALASLNQSISQMAGQSCMQITVAKAANKAAQASSGQVNIPLPCTTAVSHVNTSGSASSVSSTAPSSGPLGHRVPATGSTVKLMLMKSSITSGGKPKRATSKKSGSAKPPATKQGGGPQVNSSKPAGKQPAAAEIRPEPVNKDGSDVTEDLSAAVEASALPHKKGDVHPPESTVPSVVLSSLAAPSVVSKASTAQLLVATTSAAAVTSCSTVCAPTTGPQPGMFPTVLCTKENMPVTQEPSLADSQAPSSTASTASDSLSTIMTSISELSSPISVSRQNTSSHASGRETTRTDRHNAGKLVTCANSVVPETVPEHQTKKAGSAELSSTHAKSAPAVAKQTEEDVEADPLSMNRKETTPQQQVCALDHDTLGSSLVSSRQTDSPMSTSSGSSRGFSVASMLPNTNREETPCVSSSTNTFSSFSFSEQADIFALAAKAIFDHDTQSKKVATSSVEVPIVWEVSKSQETSTLSKERQGSQQPKLSKHSEGHTGKAQSQVQLSGERPLVSASNSSAGANHHLSVPSSQSSAPVGSLSVNNLIRQNSVSQSYACSSTLNQPTESTSVSAAVHASRSSSASLLSPCSAAGQMLEYTPLKNVPMRGHVSSELHLKQSSEHLKDASKRPPQEDLLLSTSKRQKQCHNPNIGRLDMKSALGRTLDSVPDHPQMMVSQLPPSSVTSVSSVSSSRGHPEGLSNLFPTSSFMNTVLRQSDMHCAPQAVIQEQQQSQQGGPHLQQHAQHPSAPGGLHLTSGNPYLKQQQEQQQQQLQSQRHHLYQLQHHLTQPEGQPIAQQHHGLHQQRSMQQEAQIQKKRGLVRGGPPVALQQKQHHSGAGDQTLGGPHSDKGCENQSASRSHHGGHSQSHLSQEILDSGTGRQQGAQVDHVPGQNPMQRLMTSRPLEQQMASQPSVVSRSSDIICTPSRQERNRISDYSAEALIGKSPSNTEQRMGMAIQASHVSQEQSDMRTYLEASRSKGIVHNIQGRIPTKHPVSTDVQRVSECPPFKTISTTQHQMASFEVQASRNNEMASKPVPSHRSVQSQSFRIGQGTSIDRQQRGAYPPPQGIQAGAGIQPRENDISCHQSFMQSLLAPHLGEQVAGNQRISDHQRAAQCCPPVSMEYNCPPSREGGVHLRRESEAQNRDSCEMPLGPISSRSNSINITFTSSSTAGEMQGKNASPNVSGQKPNSMRINDSQGNKGHLNPQVNVSMHSSGVRPVLPHPAAPHSSAEPVRSSVRPQSTVSQRSRHPVQDGQSNKIRPAERTRSGNLRPGNPFDPDGHLPLTSSSGMILSRQQAAAERRGSIVRFMADNPQVGGDNLTADQHGLSQNFGFPFIPESGMNPPINANPSFIPPVTQPSATRTPAIIPVEAQNTLPSFYPSYSPAAHPSLPNDISIQYFSNQMFTSPSTEKSNSGGLNNRFGSILSPPRPVGFAQPSFPLLPDMPPMPIANSSGITPHLSNFNLTSLFPEIATALPPDGSAMPMSPLLSLSNAAAADTSKQPSNRPAHNISHILGHDGSSAV